MERTRGTELLDAVDHRIRVLAQVLDPAAFDARVMLGSFDQVHEADDVVLEPLLELRVGDPSLGVDGDDAVERGLQDRPLARLAFAQRLPRGLRR